MTEELKIVGSGLALLISSGLIQYFINRHDNKHNEVAALKQYVEKGLTEREATGKTRYEEHQTSIKELRELLTQFATNTVEQKEIINANSALLVGLAQDRLVFLTDKYIKRGVITLDELAILEEIYEPYHEKLKGNGRGKAGIEMCRKLPIVSEEIAIMKDKGE